MKPKKLSIISFVSTLQISDLATKKDSLTRSAWQLTGIQAHWPYIDIKNIHLLATWDMIIVNYLQFQMQNAK